MRIITKRNLIILAASVFSVGLVTSGICYALSKFHGKQSECLSSSGGRSSILAVQYACDRADKTSNNGCSLWIGSAGSHGLPVIYVEQPTGTVPAAFWGMCTDYPDLTRAIVVKNDGGSIDSSMLLTRGTWGAPRSVPTSIDVAKFIAGATATRTKCYIEYKRTVIIGRHNGETNDYHEMPEDIYLRVPTNNKDCQIEKDLCQKWMPSSYSASTETNGTTSIIVKGRNTAERFHGMASGMWTDKKDANGGGPGRDEIYAMPTDTILWHSCYYPGVQKTAMQTQITDINGVFTNGGTGGNQYKELDTENCGDNPRVGTTGAPLWTDYQNLGFGTWENKFEVGHDINSAAGGDFGPGVWAWSKLFEAESSRGMGVANRADVGNTLTQKGVTGKPVHVTISERTPRVDIYKSPCPCHTDAKGNVIGACPPSYDCYTCTNAYQNPIKTASVSFGPDQDWFKVIIPYNYINETEIEVPKQDIYSGETEVKVSKVTATVNTRYNGTTIAEYATIVPDAKIKLFMYVSDKSDGGGGGMVGDEKGCEIVEGKQCMEVKWDDGFGALNPGGSLSGDTKTWFTNEYFNAYDASAGDYLCFVSALWPYSSAVDLQLDPHGDNMWKYSEAKCNIISKKPTFQVWGDSMYSVSNVSAYVGNKRNIYNGYFGDNKDDRRKLCRKGTNSCFAVKGSNGGAIHFGSWVEESLILKTGFTSSVASGAATGLNTDPSNYAHAGNRGDFCIERSPLTFSNNCVGGESMGGSGIGSLITNSHELIDYWVRGGTEIGNCGRSNITNLACKQIESASGVDIMYVQGSSIAVHGAVGKSETYLVDSSGTVTIDGDVVYSGTYTLLKEIPKVIIYAQNIVISCGVHEVDAILIATGNITTCSNGGDLNSGARQNQLKVFGTVMTNSIDLGRTYGAAANETGANTDKFGMPSDGAAAEIFDYDSSILLWSEYMSGSAESDTLDTTYQHELAPRY